MSECGAGFRLGLSVEPSEAGGVRLVSRAADERHEEAYTNFNLRNRKET